MLSWFYRVLRSKSGQRGSSSLEQALVAALTAAVASVFAAGVGQTGVKTADESKKHVAQSVKTVQSTITRSGPTMLQMVRLSGTHTVNYGNQKRPNSSNPPAIAQIHFQIQNNSGAPINLDRLAVYYFDRSQRHQLCGGQVTVSNIKTVTCGNVTLQYLRGAPVAGGTTKGVPTLKKGDLVRVMVNTNALPTKLGPNSDFEIRMMTSAPPMNIKQQTRVKGYGWNRL